MPENVEAWWSRRQRSKGTDVPYPIGTYRDEWQQYPMLIRQYHPDLNHNITLTQIPPAAEVLLTWQCETGHLFVATPDEQRRRPGGTRRRSSWCPECLALAAPKRVRPAPAMAGEKQRPAPPDRPAPPPALQCPSGHGPYRAGLHPDRPARDCPVCVHARAGADLVEPGDAFTSRWAPKIASAAEGDLRHRLGQLFTLDLAPNAVKTKRPFFTHVEVWPDIVMPDLRVAIEYDTTGRFGLEHVGSRESLDRRKDALLRAVGWEVVRVRCGKLQPLGPHDLQASGVTSTAMGRLVDRLRDIRGDLIVDCYLR